MTKLNTPTLRAFLDAMAPRHGRLGTMAGACRALGIDESLPYKWQARSRAGDPALLIDGEQFADHVARLRGHGLRERDAVEYERDPFLVDLGMADDLLRDADGNPVPVTRSESPPVRQAQPVPRERPDLAALRAMVKEREQQIKAGAVYTPHLRPTPWRDDDERTEGIGHGLPAPGGYKVC
ncbi:MAG: hypothetical protein ABSC37_03140 [Xanthobacteraceae bacterium]|jgi:hypothetical protein